MADRPKKKATSGQRNEERKNGKAPKKHPKVTPPRERTPEEILAQQQKHAVKRREIRKAEAKRRAEKHAEEAARAAARAERAARVARAKEAEERRAAGRLAAQRLAASLRDEAKTH